VILKTVPGRQVFDSLDAFFRTLIGYVDYGSAFMFNLSPRPGDPPLPEEFVLLRTFAFGVLPTIVFFSSLMSILYHWGIVQRVVEFFARIMQYVLGTSGAESLSAAANIFVGQTEAPLVVRPYVDRMTRSELMAVMVGGFATIAGGVLAAYVGMGIDAGHLMTASVISAPAALVIAKVMQPEVDEPQTLGRVKVEVERTTVNVVEAAAAGATDGMKLAINVAAMLIAFLALIKMGDAIVGWCGSWFEQEWTIAKLLGYAFAPLAFAMGIETKDCLPAGELLGIKMVATEFVAYLQFSEWVSAGSDVQLTERSQVILTYALSGFANFGSIGIQIGGIGGIAPDRRADLARLGVRAMLGGTLACCMTACIAGVLV
jgi:CNT family concentrative nucleoside transporter